MADRRSRLDKGAVPDEQRALWEAEIRLGRDPYVATTRSRSKIGRILDFFESIVRSASGPRYR